MNESTVYRTSLTSLKDGLISASAVLNKYRFAELWFGIRNDGTPVGVDIEEKTVQDISKAIASHIKPKIYPAITQVVLDNIPCIRIQFSGTETPYYAYGSAYIHDGDTDRIISTTELENLSLASRRNSLLWDNLTSDAEIADLDEDKIKEYISLINMPWTNMNTALNNLGLMIKGKPVNASLLFFAKKPIVKMRCEVFWEQFKLHNIRSQRFQR
jgi:ATP-dependent DNA helicase RecG